MRILIKLSALCFALLFCGTATAGQTAGELRDLCTSKKSSWQKIVCISYINGFREGHIIGMYGVVARTLGPDALDNRRLDVRLDEDYQRFSLFCYPSAVTNTQISEVFIKYMNDHPEKLHLAQGPQLNEALKLYFPCQRETKGSGK